MEEFKTPNLGPAQKSNEEVTESVLAKLKMEVEALKKKAESGDPGAMMLLHNKNRDIEVLTAHLNKLKSI